ncbi:Uncharacterised protein [Serratia plymuthica]|nr:Uncharacterised protein [Serratia plymuthica]
MEIALNLIVKMIVFYQTQASHNLQDIGGNSGETARKGGRRSDIFFGDQIKAVDDLHKTRVFAAGDKGVDDRCGEFMNAVRQH